MGGYRVRSGENLPNLNSTNLPNLPELNSLNRKQNDPKTEKPSLSFDDLALSDDEPTDVGAADDILAAVGGIDGWDNIPNSAVNSAASGANTAEPNYELSILNGTFLGEEEEDTTSVVESPFSKLTPSSQGLSAAGHLSSGNIANLPGLKSSGNGLPSPKSSEGLPSLKSSEGLPSLKSSEGLPSPKSIEGLPSPKSSEGLPSLKSNDSQGDHHSIDNMDDPLPNLKPSSQNNPSASGVASNAAAAISTAAVSPKTDESVQHINTSPAVTNSQQATAQTAPQQASAPTSREEEMTDEEQLAEILNSMTPEERAEYEAHCREHSSGLPCLWWGRACSSAMCWASDWCCCRSTRVW